MFSTQVAGGRVPSMRDDAGATIRRLGQIAGTLTIAAAVFAALYFFVLYIASE